MDEFVRQANKVKMERIIKNLKRRGMEGILCDTREDALEYIQSAVQPGDTVSWGDSVTLREIGFPEAMKGRSDITWLNPVELERGPKKEELRHQALCADKFFLSTNAVTLDGELVNIDLIGNRVAALCYGPKDVYVVCGANKIAFDEELAIRRIKTEACPANSIRHGYRTPCSMSGKCGDCLIPGNTICGMTVITRFCPNGRIHVILINDSLGF